MAQRINMMGLMSAILLGIFTLIFAIMTFMKASEVKEQLEGSEKKPQSWTLGAIRQENAKLLQSIKDKESQLESMLNDEQRAKLAAIPKHIYLDGNNKLIAYVGAEPAADGAITFPHPLERAVQEVLGVKADLTDRMTLLTKAVKEGGGARFQGARDLILRFQGETGKVLEKIAAEEKLFASDKAKRTEELERYNTLKNKESSRLVGEAILRENRILQREDEIRKLLEIELKFAEGVQPCGQLLEISTDVDRVVINLGRAQRVRPGLLFDVFQYEKGAYSEKGRIEVVEVLEDTSVARILVQNDKRRNPLARFDHIGNPLFNPLRPKVFTLAGDFLRYNASDYAAFIRAMGNEVSTSVAPGVDFLVVRGDAKDRSDDARARAREFHILGMTEQQLVRYLPLTFPTVSRGSATGARAR